MQRRLTVLLAQMGVVVPELTSSKPLEFIDALREREWLIRSINTLLGTRDRIRTSEICDALGFDATGLSDALRPCNIPGETIRFSGRCFRGIYAKHIREAILVIDSMDGQVRPPRPKQKSAPPNRKEEIPEYSAAERESLLAQYAPKKRGGWNFGSLPPSPRSGRWRSEWSGL